MTGSKSSLLLPALVSAAFLHAGAASGQGEDEPLFIVPLEPVEDIEDIDPVDDVVVTDTVEEADSAPAEDEEAPLSGLEIVALPAVDAGSVGILEEGRGGFPWDMWQGSDGALVGGLMGVIETRSTTVLDLARRLLASSSKPPAAAADNWLGLRVAGLIALGLPHDAQALIGRAGMKALDRDARRGLVDIRLLSGDNEAACREVQALIGLEDVPSLTPALVFCQRLAGLHDMADLSLAVHRDAGLELDPRFLALEAALSTGEPPPLESLAGASPLLFAMAVESGTRIAHEALAGAPPALLRAIAGHGGLPVDLRLGAAERLVARGLMPGGELAALYHGAGASGAAAGEEPGTLLRARLFREMAASATVRERARGIASLVHQGAAAGEPSAFLAAAAAAAGELALMTPDNDLGWFSAQAVLTLLAAGRPEEAARWWPLVERRAVLDESAAAEAVVFWPLLRLWMGEALADDGQTMHRWWRTISAVAPQRARRLGGLYLVLMNALGDPAGEPLVGDMLAAWSGEPPARAAVAAPELHAALRLASEEGRLGETVLLSIALLGSGEPRSPDVIGLAAVVEALMRAGLEREARLLAVEVAFANAV